MDRNRDDRGRDRDRDGGRGSRDNDRGGRDDRDRDRDRGGRDRGDNDRGGRSSSRGRVDYEYTPRSREEVQKRATLGANEYDKYLRDDVKVFKVNDGDNTVRVLPPTWREPKPSHYGLDIYVHYGIGPDRQTYLCLHKMKGEACPICEERQRAQKAGDDDYAKELEPKRRVLVYMVDRDHEKEGVQAWAMPWTLDRDITGVSVDKKSGEVLPVDHPEEGYDIEFTKKGAQQRTEYTAVTVSRRSSPLDNDDALRFAVDSPLPEILHYFPYEHIERVFGGGGTHRDSRGNDDRGERDRDSGNDRSNRDKDDGRSGRDRDRSDSKLTWRAVHEMTSRELDDLIEEHRLDINPNEAKDDEDLADWICEELKIEKEEAPRRREATAPAAEDDPREKLRRMREDRNR